MLLTTECLVTEMPEKASRPLLAAACPAKAS
jgi:hypothetical protein